MWHRELCSAGVPTLGYLGDAFRTRTCCTLSICHLENSDLNYEEFEVSCSQGPYATFLVQFYRLSEMPPKKKGNKKGGDDWETDLGEDPIAAATQESKDAEAAQDGVQHPDDGGGGGLMAALKKNKANKKKKGKAVEEDWLDGEDPPNANGVNGHAEPDGIQNLAIKAPEEADANDLFDVQVTKAKGGKGKQGKREGNLIPNEDGEASGDEGGTTKSKKEKEKEKREREKQRKKEQVCSAHLLLLSYRS